jgi:hypothetical protein
MSYDCWNITLNTGKPETPMSDFEFTSNGIEKLLSDLNPSKASGPDLLPTRIIKLVASEIAPVLSVIFQQSFEYRSKIQVYN